MKKLKSFVLALVMVCSFVLFSACGAEEQLDVKAKLDMSGDYKVAQASDMEEALELCEMNEKGYHATITIKKGQNITTSNSYSVYDEQGNIVSFAGELTTKMIDENKNQIQYRYITYLKENVLYIKVQAKGKAIVGNKKTELSKNFTYFTTFQGQSVSDILNVYTGINYDGVLMFEEFSFGDFLLSAMLEDKINYTYAQSGSVKKFKVVVSDYSEFLTEDGGINLYNKNMIFENTVLKGYELKIGYEEESVKQSLEMTMQAFDGNIDFPKDLDTFSVTPPSFHDINNFMTMFDFESEVSFDLSGMLGIGGDWDDWEE